MSMRINLYPKLIPTQQQPAKLKPTTMVGLRNRANKTRTKCSSSSESFSVVGDMLADSLAKHVAKRNTLLAQTREAIEKTRNILFTELCLYVSMETHELKAKWKCMDEDDKWDLVRGFVSVWAVNFHPLSPKSVKELVDEELSG